MNHASTSKRLLCSKVFDFPTRAVSLPFLYDLWHFSYSYNYYVTVFTQSLPLGQNVGKNSLILLIIIMGDCKIKTCIVY